MGIFDQPLFDLNGDGKTDLFEFALAMGTFEELEKLEEDTRGNDKILFDADEEEDEDDGCFEIINQR